MIENSNIVRATQVLDVPVKSPEGEDLGEIEEIILDKLSGQVRYVVLSFGGFLGLGEKLFAIPWHIIRYDPKLSCFILNIDKEKIKNAPGFIKDNWPDFADKQWENSVGDYYKF